MIDLLPCPFCGGEPIQRGDFIECARCSAQGPTDRETKTGWNTRADGAAKDLLARWHNIALNGNYGASTQYPLSKHPIVGETASALSSTPHHPAED